MNSTQKCTPERYSRRMPNKAEIIIPPVGGSGGRRSRHRKPWTLRSRDARVNSPRRERNMSLSGHFAELLSGKAASSLWEQTLGRQFHGKKSVVGQ
jgi:hypothetical protein